MRDNTWDELDASLQEAKEAMAAGSLEDALKAVIKSLDAWRRIKGPLDDLIMPKISRP